MYFNQASSRVVNSDVWNAPGLPGHDFPRGYMSGFVLFTFLLTTPLNDISWMTGSYILRLSVSRPTNVTVTLKSDVSREPY